MKDEIIKVNGVDLHVIDYGGEGEPIICVHGLTANCRFWDAMAERLTQDYRVITFDLRGRGDSQKPANGYHIEQHAKDIKGILDYFNIEKAIFIGHSLGAMMGCCFAATYTTRISHLILIDGGADIDPMVAELLRPTIGRIGKVYKSFKEYTDELKQAPFFKEWNSYIEQYFNFDVMHNKDGSVVTKVNKNAIVEEMENLQNTKINKFHSEINVPTLILWAANSLHHPSHYILTKEKGMELAGIIPNSRFVSINDADHYSIIFNKYEEVSHEIKFFLIGNETTKKI